MSNVEVLSKTVYRFTPDSARDYDDFALVYIQWHYKQEDVVMKCALHHVYVGLNSNYPSPCVCIDGVREYRRSAFLTDNKEAE